LCYLYNKTFYSLHLCVYVSYADTSLYEDYNIPISSPRHSQLLQPHHHHHQPASRPKSHVGRQNNTIITILLCIMCVHDNIMYVVGRGRRPRRGRRSPPLGHSRGTSKPFVVLRSLCPASSSHRSGDRAATDFFPLQAHNDSTVCEVLYR